jgi:endonuclease YncB( thermonuclease family)
MKIFTLLKCSVLLLALQAQADTLVGKVIHVADGDTLTVLDDAQTQHKIRLAGIDAPESKQAFGQVSKQSLADHVAGEVVAVEWDKMDRYGRKVGKVLLGGQDANLRQIQRGLAWHYKAYEQEQTASDRKAYATAENEAKVAKVGLWKDVAAQPPWEFRRNK